MSHEVLDQIADRSLLLETLTLVGKAGNELDASRNL
jgi:hypothetical protein